MSNLLETLANKELSFDEIVNLFVVEHEIKLRADHQEVTKQVKTLWADADKHVKRVVKEVEEQYIAKHKALIGSLKEVKSTLEFDVSIKTQSNNSFTLTVQTYIRSSFNNTLRLVSVEEDCTSAEYLQLMATLETESKKQMELVKAISELSLKERTIRATLTKKRMEQQQIDFTSDEVIQLLLPTGSN